MHESFQKSIGETKKDEEYIPFQNYFKNDNEQKKPIENSVPEERNSDSKERWDKMSEYLSDQDNTFKHSFDHLRKKTKVDMIPENENIGDYRTLKKKFIALSKENREMKELLSKSINMKNVALQGMKKMDGYISELLREIELLKEDLNESKDSDKDNLMSLNEVLNEKLINNDEAIKDLKSTIEELKGTNKQSSNEYERRVKNLKTKVKDLKDKYENLWLSIEEKNNSISKLEDKIDDYSNLNASKEEKLARKIQELDKLRNYIAKLEDESRKQIEKNNFEEGGIVSGTQLNNRVDTLLNEKHNLAKLLSEEKSVSFGLMREIKELKEELHSKEGEINFLREHSDSRSNFTNESKSNSFDDLDIVQDLKVKIDELNLLLTDKEDHFKDAQKRIEELKVDLTEANNIIKKYKNSVISLTESNINLNNNNDSLNSLLSKNEDELKDIIIKNDTLTQKVDDYIHENNELKSNLDEALTSISKMKTKLSAIIQQKLSHIPESSKQDTQNSILKKRKINFDNEEQTKKRKLL